MRKPMISLRQRQPTLKPQDLYLLMILASRQGEGTTYPELSVASGLALSAVHSALKRCQVARLLHFDERKPRVLIDAFKEFLFHGAKYAFPAVRGGIVAGLPSGYAAEPLRSHVAPSADPPPVWASIEGTTRGWALIPLYPTVPDAARRSPTLYEYLALFDAIRAGTARERALAQTLFEERLS